MSSAYQQGYILRIQQRILMYEQHLQLANPNDTRTIEYYQNKIIIERSKLNEVLK